jgi:TatD DNase family protein
MLIDTHSHLYEDSFLPDWEEVIARCQLAAVNKILLPNVDRSTILPMQEAVKKNPDLLIPMMGLHPCSVKENYLEEMSVIKQELYSGKFVAVGEIGIDLYWDKSFAKEQEEVFLTQVQWANELNLPISIHSRESTRIIIDILKTQLDCKNKGIFHCFSGSLEEAKEIIDMGYYLGIGGVITFKNSQLPNIVSVVGMDRIVLETDSPYLAPMPHRGKRNESSYTSLVALKLADIFHLSLEQVSEKTTHNAISIFKIDEWEKVKY